MTRGPILQEIWDNLPEERKQRIQKRAAQLKEEYLSLQELCKTAGLTQANISKELNMPQSNISQVEKSSDMLLSTLRSHIEAVGGKLNLTVELPNKTSINLTGFGDLLDNQTSQIND